jgi:hypothetical protein
MTMEPVLSTFLTIRDRDRSQTAIGWNTKLFHESICERASFTFSRLRHLRIGIGLFLRHAFGVKMRNLMPTAKYHALYDGRTRFQTFLLGQSRITSPTDVASCFFEFSVLPHLHDFRHSELESEFSSGSLFDCKWGRSRFSKRLLSVDSSFFVL